MPEFRRVRLINPRKKSSRSRARRRAQRNKSGRFVKRSAARRTSATRPRRRRAKRTVRRVSRPRARARKKNPLGEELILLSNPRRKKRTTNGRRRRRTNPFRTTVRRRRSNPRRFHSRRRNPEGAGAKQFAIEGVKAIAAGAVGAVGTRAIVQGILGDKNVGMMGYAANLAVALGGGFLLFKFTKSKSIALGWAVGGAANTVQRIWSEKVSMTSPAAAAPALGDLDYSSNGMGGVGLSGFVNTGFALPSVTDGGGVVQQPFQTQQPAVSAAAGSGPGGAAVLNIPGGNVARYQPRY